MKRKKENEGEASERTDAEYLIPINGDIGERDVRRFSLLRTLCHHFEVYLLGPLSPLVVLEAAKQRGSPAFCAVLFFIPLQSSPPPSPSLRYRSSSRELAFFPRFLARPSPLSILLSLSPTLFSEAKGRDPERQLINMIPESDTRKPLIIPAGAARRGASGTRAGAHTPRAAKWKIFTGLSAAGRNEGEVAEFSSKDRPSPVKNFIRVYRPNNRQSLTQEQPSSLLGHPLSGDVVSFASSRVAAITYRSTCRIFREMWSRGYARG